MKLIKRKNSIKSIINRIVRSTQRVEVTTVSPNITTIREVFKNKQIITVAANIDLRCLSKL